MSLDAQRRHDSAKLDQQTREQIAMTRAEREAKVVDLRKFVENLEQYATTHDEALTERQIETIRSARNVIASIEAGLLNEDRLDQ